VWANAHIKGGRAMDDEGKQEGHQRLVDSAIGKPRRELERRSRVEGCHAPTPRVSSNHAL